MVNPRLNSLNRNIRRTTDVTRRRDGMIQRGRVSAFDALRGTATVVIYGVTGQTATLENVRVLGFGPARDADLHGADVALLVPSGRPSDGVWILGRFSTPEILASTAGQPVVTVSNAVDRPIAFDLFDSEAWRLTLTSDVSTEARSVRLGGVEVGLDSIQDAVPRLEIKVGGLSAVYEPQRQPEATRRATTRVLGREAIDLPSVQLLPVSDALVIDIPANTTVDIELELTARRTENTGSFRAFIVSGPIPRASNQGVFRLPSESLYGAVRVFGRVN